MKDIVKEIFYNNVMSELLSPSGTKEAFKAAISNGADAIYLGLDKFSARAYANNFTIDSLKELLDFAHLRNVKIFVTINTIIFDDELNDVYDTIDKLANMGVDAIIIQDLAVFNYIVNKYESLHPHASTQMGVDDLQAASLLKDIGFKRIVFARETPIEKIKEIKDELNIEVETFIHGALCVSYSGNCYMSSSIGERSGNRGRCAGCCRKYYSLEDLTNNQNVGEGYLLSLKDLNTSQYINKMAFIDSLKIEGRMKEPNYVASVTNYYRHLLDKENVEADSLLKVFNRTYTKGFVNDASKEEVANIERPNNYGYLIGEIIKKEKDTIWIRLHKSLSKGDQIRIETLNKRIEISLPITRLYDGNFNMIETASKTAIISCKEKVNIGAKVYKTKDAQFVDEANRSLLKNEYKKLPIKMELNCHIGKPLFLKVTYQEYKVFVKSENIVNDARTSPLTKDDVIKQLSKLNETPYYLNNIDISLDENCFATVKELNELRRAAIEKLNSQRLSFKVKEGIKKEIVPQKHSLIKPIMTVEVSNEEQYEIVKSLGIENIYFKNVIRRNNVTYPEINGDVLVNGYGGIKNYLNKNRVITDSSLNVTNHVAAAILSSLGVDRITLSQEISKDNIKKLIANYYQAYNTYPNLELIVYGRSKIMHSKYCPLKKLDKCGNCKKAKFALKDDFASFPIIFNDDCTITLLNSKTLNIMDELVDLKGINYYRLVFTTETKEEIIKIINHFNDVLANNASSSFNGKDETRGHFFSNPL